MNIIPLIITCMFTIIFFLSTGLQFFNKEYSYGLVALCLSLLGLISIIFQSINL